MNATIHSLIYNFDPIVNILPNKCSKTLQLTFTSDLEEDCLHRLPNFYWVPVPFQTSAHHLL